MSVNVLAFSQHHFFMPHDGAPERTSCTVVSDSRQNRGTLDYDFSHPALVYIMSPSHTYTLIHVLHTYTCKYLDILNASYL